MLRLILKENSFQFNGSTISKNPRYRDENIQQFPSNIFMAAYIETQSLSKTFFKPTVWKRYINDIFSLWDMVDFFKFTEQVNLLHPTALLALKLTAEISDTRTIFFDTVVYQGTTLNEKWEKAIIDVKTHFKRKPSCIYISPLKSGWWTEAGHTILKEKLLLEVKLTEGSSTPEKKQQQGRKRNIVFRDTIQTLSVYYKRSVNENCNLVQN